MTGVNLIVYRAFIIICSALCLNGYLFAAQQLKPQSGNDDVFDIVEITDGLEHPWGMAFLPDGRIMVTERPGRLRIIHNGKLDLRPIVGLPKIKATGQGGLLDVILHPDFKQNQLLYLSYVAGNRHGIGTEVVRARLNGHQLSDQKVIFQLSPKTQTSRHFGSRLIFDRQGFLYVTLGDRGERPRAQKLNDHAGSVLRIYDDGAVPDDNPFVKITSAKSQIFSYGHRNPQGMALHPETGKVWIHEHGPQGGDEINIIQKGQNYGWPVITYGVNYVIGTSIGEGTHKEGMLQPFYFWVPSIAPSGMAFYSGNKFVDWQGDLLVGSLKFQQLVHLKIANNEIVEETRYLKGKLGRIRDVKVGPDGYLYLLTDSGNGRLVQLKPAQ